MPATLALVLLACEAKPVEIVIKGPREAVESTKARPTFAPFTKKNDSLRLRASAFDERGRYMGPAKVKWRTSDGRIATVNQSGVVTVLSSGKFEVRAETTDTQPPLEASVDLEAIIIDGVRFTDPKPEKGKSFELAMGEIKQLVVEVYDDNGQVVPEAKVYWRSTGYAATVTPTGEIEGRAIGSTQIVAEADNKVARLDIQVGDWKKKKKKKR